MGNYIAIFENIQNSLNHGTWKWLLNFWPHLDASICLKIYCNTDSSPLYRPILRLYQKLVLNLLVVPWQLGCYSLKKSSAFFHSAINSTFWINWHLLLLIIMIQCLLIYLIQNLGLYRGRRRELDAWTHPFSCVLDVKKDSGKKGEK